ncbi:hypothetical protein TEA_017266 [Camellia sinensis var. sinensis]|uniref:UmuC domain-containing protein n=1 Tax=Camellia sinensis var. sinensis TaxID=542762 RepID=A0A4S4DBJ0_CAMSN|nr:hypothetical protein TEA_017266 [Camellia sinensis var. sinensis]
MIGFIWQLKFFWRSRLDGSDHKDNVRECLHRSDADHLDKLLACGALIVAELRRQVLKETEFTCSAGIAHNKEAAWGKLGSSLQIDLGVNTVGELLQFSEEKLQERYGVNTGTWLRNIARGISGEEVEGRLLPKSHGSGKTFPGPQALKKIASSQFSHLTLLNEAQVIPNLFPYPLTFDLTPKTHKIIAL